MMTIDTRTYDFDFGKYKGYSFDYVMRVDPSYLSWLVDENNGFELDDDTLDELDKRLKEIVR
jgi:hypothetical protein